ncbi:MAG: DUF4339 domain-containing protein [Marinilabiliales bacterium]|nr:DUF4339 domain-containing protein [Marinilabiliales bacterium]
MEGEYYYIKDSERFGPVNKDLLVRMIDHNTYIWSYGYNDWTEARNVPDIKNALDQRFAAPPFIPPFQQQAKQATKPRYEAPRYVPEPAKPNHGMHSLYIWLFVSTLIILAIRSASAVAEMDAFNCMQRDDLEFAQKVFTTASLINLFLFPFFIVFYIVFMKILYRGWKLMQINDPRLTPGKIVGYLFIPFYNLYWIFIAIGSWSKHANRRLQQLNISHEVGSGIGISLAISALTSFLLAIIQVIVRSMLVYEPSGEMILGAQIVSILYYFNFSIAFVLIILFSKQIHDFSKLTSERS